MNDTESDDERTTYLLGQWTLGLTGLTLTALVLCATLMPCALTLTCLGIGAGAGLLTLAINDVGECPDDIDL